MSYTADDVLFFKNHLRTNGGVEIFIKHLLQCGRQNVHTPFDLCREMLGKVSEYTSLKEKEVAVLFNLEFLHVLIRDYKISSKNITIFVDDKRKFEMCKCEYRMIPDVNLFYVDMEETLKEEALHILGPGSIAGNARLTDEQVVRYNKSSQEFVNNELSMASLPDGMRSVEWEHELNGNLLSVKTRPICDAKGKVMKKFTVTCGNPPYQADNGNKGAGNILWDKFIAKSHNITDDGGYVLLVHPSLWRKPNHQLQKYFTSNDLKYLEIHDEKDGLRVFGAETRYDWYVLQKVLPSGKTIVKGQDGELFEVDHTKSAFIPNCEFKLVQKLMADDQKDRVEILNSQSAYEPRREWMSDEKNATYKHPCIYMMPKDGIPKLKWSSRNDKGHFGVPKVIYSSGRPVSVGFLVDKTGEYGMTQWASGIVDAPENLEKIATALRSDRFRQFCAAISMSKLEIATSVLRFFRKDFWKEFLS